MTQRVVNYTYGTGNPVLPDGSIDVRDGIDNLQSFDIFMNADEDTYNQRDGDIVQTVSGALKRTGFKPGSGDFTTGFTVMPGERDIAWYDQVSSNWYSYLGFIPTDGYPVPPGTNPVGSVDWAPRTDELLRAELSLPGGVGLVGGAHIVPEMFYSGTGPHSAAVQAAFDRSDATGELVYLGGQYFFDVPVSVKNGVNVISGQRASVSPYSGSGNGTAFDFVAGNSNRRFELPALSGFVQVGVPAVAVRCDLAKIYVRQFVGCHTCFKTITDASNNSILDLIMEFNTISGCEVAWEAYCGQSGNILQGCELKGNFVTDTTRCFKRTGVAAFDDGVMVDLNAFDLTNRVGGGVFLDNQVAGHQMSRFTARVKSWFGGTGFTMVGADAGKIVSGQFVSGEMYLATVQGFLQGNLPANLWRSGVAQTMSTVATLAQVRDMPSTPTLASFNGGVPLSNTEFIVRLTLTADLSAGAQAVGYFYNIWADGSYPRWQATPIEGNTRLMLASIKDQSGTESSRVELAVRNIDSSPVVAGQSVIFRVSRR